MNFSKSEIWNNSLFIRYPIEKIFKLGNLYYFLDGDTLICQSFFNLGLEKKDLDEIKKVIFESKKVRFSYIDDVKDLKALNKLSKDNNFVYEVIDSWEAPRLFLDQNPSSYLENYCGLQIKKNYKKYLNVKKEYKIINSENNDVLKLWSDVLKIDTNSWKKLESSDMKSLNREDLQYFPFLLLDKENSNLVVIYDKKDTPLAYSLMFKNNDMWYAVKWGASFQGRKEYAGFYALFNHLEYIYSKDKTIRLDFWGRRNKTYDSLKNDSVNRNHIKIYKEN